MASLDDRVLRLEAMVRQLQGGLVDALPDQGGGIVHFQAAEGVVWSFRYNPDSSSPYKWEFIGGPPLVVESSVTLRTITSTSFANVPTDPISLTLPALAGDYDIEVGGHSTSPGGLDALYLSYAVGATAASENWAHSTGFSSNATGAFVKRWTGVAAGAVVAEKARVTASSAGVLRRRLRVWPVRVG